VTASFPIKFEGYLLRTENHGGGKSASFIPSTIEQPSAKKIKAEPVFTINPPVKKEQIWHCGDNSHIETLHQRHLKYCTICQQVFSNAEPAPCTRAGEILSKLNAYLAKQGATP
jgi:hypothetical protein